MRRLDLSFLIPLFYLAAISCAEMLAAFAHPRPGIMLHCLLLLALLWHSAWAPRRRERALLLCLTLPPLIRIISLWLSAAGLTALSLILATSLPLFAAAWIAGRFLGYPWQTLGLETRALPGQIAVASTGLGLGTLQYLILRPPPLAPAQTWAQIWPPALILLVSTGLLEELIFRGLLLRTATQALGAWGLAYSALLFATMQLGYRCPAHAAFAFAMGAFFACVVQRTRSLSGVTLAHGLANTLTFLVMPSVFAP